MEGFSRGLAVIGGSNACIATYPSDMAVALRVLDAEIETLLPNGAARRIGLADFHALPGETPHVESVLEPGELIIAVLLPQPVGGIQRYLKLRDRASYAFANVSIALIVHFESADLSAARIAFGGLAPKPWRIEAAEGAISAAASPADHISDIAFEGARPTEHNAFKLLLARRALAVLLDEAREIATR